jgi:hypothetical protein
MYIKYFILTLVTLLVACSPVPETTETPAGSYDRTINLATNPPPFYSATGGRSSRITAWTFRLCIVRRVFPRWQNRLVGFR